MFKNIFLKYFFSFFLIILFGFALILGSLSYISIITSSVALLFGAVLAICLAVAFVSVYFITKTITDPLKDLSSALKKLSDGDLSARLPETPSYPLFSEFNQMAESLRAAKNARGSFIANISHDLKNPMTSISGFIDGILDGTIPENKREHYLNVVSSEIKRLSRLLTDLLDLSKIESGERKFKIQAFDIAESARRVLISLEDRINEKALDVELVCENDSIYASADADAIYETMYNICDNAVKFSKDRGKLKISIAPADDAKLLICIFNEGQGISPSDIPYIFDRSYRTDISRKIDRSGSGLGMHIAKTIIEAHGESICVESEYGKNCCFKFTLTKADRRKEVL